MRSRIIVAATTILSEQGYSAATVKNIAALAGVSVGALQHQFVSKAKLMAAVVEGGLAQRMATFRRRVRETPVARGVDVLAAGGWRTARQPEFLAMLEVALARRSDAELRAETDALFLRMERTLERWSRRLWQSHGVSAELASIGRRMVSTFLTGLALRAASGLETDAGGLAKQWERVLDIFYRSPDLQNILTSLGRITATSARLHSEGPQLSGDADPPQPSRVGAADDFGGLALDLLTKILEMVAPSTDGYTELVVHDLRRPEASIVAIANGGVSGRRIGQSVLAGPAGDKALRHIATGGPPAAAPRIVQFDKSESTSRKGDRLTSSSVAVFNPVGPVAAFCVNADIAGKDKAIGEIRRAFRLDAQPKDDPAAPKQGVEELVAELIEGALPSDGTPVARMTKAERINAIKQMRARGVFLIKGAIERVANRLGTTKFTIYNYLDEIERRDLSPAD